MKKPRRKEPISPARSLAHRALVEASKRNVFADRRLRELFEEENPTRSDRALATLLVQETLRRRGSLDHRLALLLERGVRSLRPPVLEALRLGLVQILHLDRVPARAAVDESVRIVREAGYEEMTGVVNAVLRRAARGDVPELPGGDDDAALSARHSFPPWLLRRWRRLGDDLVPALEGSNRIPDVVLRVNTARTSVARVIAALETAGARGAPGALAPGSVRVTGRLDLETFEPLVRGLVSVQDESESLVVELLDPLPGHEVLDVCAAPGGKSAHVMERTLGHARLVAADADPRRLRRVRGTLERVRYPARLLAADGRRSPLSAAFDRVLVDAPCTGTGVLARRAEARWRLESDHPRRAASVQLELLVESAALVMPGGLLAYAVCSIEPEETTGVVERFLERVAGMVEEPVDALPEPARTDEGRLFLLPGRHGSDGVFGVRFRRTG